jgi:2-succinyl-6-hydroxy-2,4-cyclohexadiene-1-carboxylate synthase
MAAKRVRAGELEIAYDEVGGGERPLVLVHGFTGHRRDFEPQLPGLAAFGRTLAPDLRGHGETGAAADPAGYTLARLVDDLLAFLDALGVGRCDLLGHSLGGMVALRAVLRAPERVASLVLMDSAARALDFLPADAFRLAWTVARSAGMERLQALVRERAATDALRTEADRRLEREWGAERYWARQRERFCAVDPEAYAGLGRELLEQESLVARLGEIRCPTLVLVGEGDAPFVREAELLAEHIPDARRAVVPDAGHQPQLENPAAWLAAIREHLVRVRPRI